MRAALLALLLTGCMSQPRSDRPAPDGGSMSGGGAGGGGGGGAGGTGGGGGTGPVTPPGARITSANPIVSRQRPLVSSSGASSMIDGSSVALTTLDDGQLFIGDGFGGGAGDWVGIDLATGPSRILVSWISLGSVDMPEAAPVDYHLDVSPDGQKWTSALTITGNETNAREHALDFAGQRFFRLVIDKTDASGRTHLIELEAYDASKGTDDTWIVLGDSISAMSLNRWLTPDLPTTLHKARPGFFPLVIDEAIGGTNATSAQAEIDGWIARFPDLRNWVVAYGTNDGICDTTGRAAPAYHDNLGKLVDKLQAAGKRVLVPHIPWNGDCSGKPANLQPFDDAIDSLRAEKGFLAGPDLTSWFAAHQDQLGADRTHPTDAGSAAITAEWAAAVTPLYPDVNP